MCLQVHSVQKSDISLILQKSERSDLRLFTKKKYFNFPTKIKYLQNCHPKHSLRKNSNETILHFFSHCVKDENFPYRKDGMNVKKINGLAQELATAKKTPNFCSGEFWT